MQDKVPDRYTPLPFDRQHLAAGVLAERMKVNLEQRLLKVDEKAITDGFVHRPGSHPWIGEHAGKFLHAAANTYAYTHDARLKTLMDRVANTLIKSQLPDGYLGTYSDDKRWTSWDVWSHKYDLIGLLAWYDVTHDERALACCTKIGDLLCRTFGDGPGQRDLSLSGEHMGMAATSVLEPMCYLYRHTGDPKYLDFCRYITRNIEQHSKVISSLTSGKRVDETANRKSYEMLSTIVGLVELYRVTGDEQFLTPAVTAWTDIVNDGHLFLTGTTSTHEHFDPPGHLPGGVGDEVGEGCVTVTWLQLNLALLKTTGEAKYADQLERTIYNQLLAAQNPTTGDICYFTPQVGPKPYRNDVNCCLSSEPRGISMIPLAVWGTSGDAVCLNLFAPGHATVDTVGTDGQPITLDLTSKTSFPISSKVELTLKPSRPAHVTLKVRQPSWCPTVFWPGDQVQSAPGQYARHIVDLPKEGATITFEVVTPTVFARADESYPHAYAVVRGPQVLAIDAATSKLPLPTSATVTDVSGATVDAARPAYTYPGLISRPDPGTGRLSIVPAAVTLIPFSDATSPIVWLPTREHLLTGPLPVTYGGGQSASRPGNRVGSITDLLPDTLLVTYNRKKEAQDWFAVELPKPAPVGRVVFRHGQSFHDGGWFDASKGKPQVQVKAAGGADGGGWQTVGNLDTYPDTTAADDKGMRPGQAFELVLKEPVTAAAVRVIGTPASGDRPKQSFSSCSELDAYSEESK